MEDPYDLERFVAAQDKCDAQNIVDTCVQGYQSRIDACNENPNDFICLCDVYRDVLVCYNNCPGKCSMHTNKMSTS